MFFIQKDISSMTEEEQLALAIQMSKTCKYFYCLGLNISLDIELVFTKSHSRSL